GDREAHRFRADVGMIAANDAGPFEGPHPAQAWRCGYTCSAGEVHVGHATVVLQVAQDPVVDAVELGARHQYPPNCCALCQTIWEGAIKLRNRRDIRWITVWRHVHLIS